MCAGAYLHPGLTDDRQGQGIGWGVHDEITRDWLVAAHPLLHAAAARSGGFLPMRTRPPNCPVSP